MLTVSIPTFNTPVELLDRAIASVLRSPEVDRVVVVNDGGAKPQVPRDPRVLLFRLPDNHGRYFCDAVVTEAIDGWWSPQDADDWSEWGRWQNYEAAPVRLGAYVRHKREGTKAVVRPSQPNGFRDVGHWCAGTYQIDRVWAAGGILPHFRVGFDTLFLLMAHLTGPVEVDRRVTYHYERRNGSLTSDRRTGTRSTLRKSQAAQLAHLYASASRHAEPAKVLRASIPARTRRDVYRHATRLRSLLC